MANPFERLVSWIDESEQATRSRRESNVVTLMYEGFRLVQEAIDYRYEIQPPLVALTSYDPEPGRSSESNLHGGLASLATAQPLDSVPTNINVSKGIGRILVVVNAGSDTVGSITVTGTSVDRDSGTETGSDTDTLTVNGTTNDNSSTDGNGNTVHGFGNAYITTKWFRGSVTLSTTNLTLTDVDVWHLSYEQFNDLPFYVVRTLDINLYTTNVLAEFDAYLYALIDNNGSGSNCTVLNLGSVHVGTNGATAIANRYERLRRGNIDKAMLGATDGIWIDVHYANTPAYCEDVTTKVWAQYTTPQDASGDIAAQNAQTSGVVTRVAIASGDLSTSAATIDGVAIWADVMVPDGEITAQSATVSGAVVRTAFASGDLDAGEARINNGFEYVFGALTAGDASMSGSVKHTLRFTAAITSEPAEIDGAARLSVLGISDALTTGPATIDGSASVS